jgi:hypothetical protein
MYNIMIAIYDFNKPLNKILSGYIADGSLPEDIQTKTGSLMKIVNSKENKIIVQTYIIDMEKLLNDVTQDDTMSEKDAINSIKKLIDNGLIVANGVVNIARLGQFSSELGDLVEDNIIEKEKAGVLNEIMEQYLFAKRSLNIYHNAKTYQFIRKESRQLYRNIKTKEIESLMKKYVDKVFLEYSKSKTPS